MENNELLTPFDEATSSRELQILKTLLPFIPISQQRQLALIIELLQMQRTLNYIDSASNLLTAQNLPEESDNRIAMLSAVKKFCSPEDQETIDNIINILSIMESQL